VSVFFIFPQVIRFLKSPVTFP